MKAIDDFELVDGSIVASIVRFFDLPPPEEDRYSYKAETSVVTLQQVSDVLASGQNRYRYAHGADTIAIPMADVDAYCALFSSNSHPARAMASFLANARKGSPRRSVAEYLAARRAAPGEGDGGDREAVVARACVSRRKRHANPYLDLWRETCRQVGFVGPLGDAHYADPRAARLSHPLLPVLMHHFGCAIPSFAALACVAAVAGGRAVLDVGCGNGYWTCLLRREGVAVVAVDDGSSAWRTTWVDDVVRADGLGWLRAHAAASRDAVLLLVYPIVGGDDLTRRLLSAYRGRTVAYVGTQNANRYTGFRDCTVEEYMSAQAWTMKVRLPLPSFPGKDDALYIFER